MSYPLLPVSAWDSTAGPSILAPSPLQTLKYRGLWEFGRRVHGRGVAGLWEGGEGGGYLDSNDLT